MRRITPLLMLLVVFPMCHREVDDSRARIALRLELPAALAPRSSRYARFLERVISLKVRAVSKEGFRQEFTFPPERWEKIELTEIDFPKSEQDSLDLHIQVWDKKRDGNPRAYPVLLGKKRIDAKDIKKGELTEAPLKLSLQVSSSDYDLP